MGMGCRRASELLPAYASRDLSGEILKALEAHLAICDRCASELHKYERIDISLSLLAREPVPVLSEEEFWTRFSAGRHKGQDTSDFIEAIEQAISRALESPLQVLVPAGVALSLAFVKLSSLPLLGGTIGRLLVIAGDSLIRSRVIG